MANHHSARLGAAAALLQPAAAGAEQAASPAFKLFGAHYEHTGQGCKGCPFVDGTSCLLATFRPDRVLTEIPCGFEWASGQPHDQARIEATAAKGPPDEYIKFEGQLWAVWKV